MAISLWVLFNSQDKNVSDSNITKKNLFSPKSFNPKSVLFNISLSAVHY